MADGAGEPASDDSGPHAAADSLLWLGDSTDDACLGFGTQHSESRFKAVFDAASVGIALTSTDGLVFMANRSFCEMLSCTEEALKGVDLGSFVLDEDRESHQAALRAVIERRGARLPSEHRLRRGDGAVLDVRTTSSLIHDNAGEAHTVVVVVEDLSERKRLERDRAQKKQLESEMSVARQI